MAVHIQLDRPYAYFTNLDIITGRVILSIFSEETISAINVKLECESRTRLAMPPRGGSGYRGDRSQTELEVHKLLYKVQTVFPSAELLQQQSGERSSFTLRPGSHEYPFQFKIPFNNSCSSTNSMLTNLHVSGARMEMARDTNRHVKKPLPPTLSGFPGEAEIQYFLKATVQRPAFYKENFRARSALNFLPIEPPRTAPNLRESYARRNHQFAPHVPLPQKQNVLRKQSTGSISGTIPPKISIDGRLPDPAVITLNESLPLRVLVKKLNETPETIFLKLLQVELIGYTQIRAHELERKESSSWVIVSRANLTIPLGNSNTPVNKDMEIDKKLWSNIPVPNSVPPTFDTCNLTRFYELEIRVGLAYGSPGNLKPELTVQSLRMPVQVYSGITPPPALLAELAKRSGPSTANVRPPQGTTTNSSPGPSSYQPPPFSSSMQSSPNSTNIIPPSFDMPEDAPPSYEDAMAEDLAPVDGPRRDYHQPQTAPIVGDSKRSGLFGGNERLFP
ncbi:hypothetical protein MMC11_004580 [Xylographa trunciseda]|nr:hypothetical protein [Xylographa trunciseda]